MLYRIRLNTYRIALGVRSRRGDFRSGILRKRVCRAFRRKSPVQESGERKDLELRSQESAERKDLEHEFLNSPTLENLY